MCGAPVAGALLSRQQTATKGMLPLETCGSKQQAVHYERIVIGANSERTQCYDYVTILELT